MVAIRAWVYHKPRRALRAGAGSQVGSPARLLTGVLITQQKWVASTLASIRIDVVYENLAPFDGVKHSVRHALDIHGNDPDHKYADNLETEGVLCVFVFL